MISNLHTEDVKSNLTVVVLLANVSRKIHWWLLKGRCGSMRSPIYWNHDELLC
ncbi:hypothetical protein H6G76_28725 [Nostoc sp. FACHB-152]|uniref:hypothetical protein n=1 Tax=unclassified Nostoc TaxID=2593658 RepID=UPI001684F5E7|nr:MULTISPECIES: hypothetical protein [unclassified Nostoc]MBD2451043.1 hypothetical protein [Nostoc sp. FACHB-152]MBD2471081.1 hypothetical protein [Nostoc sp. FACHB-145]